MGSALRQSEEKRPGYRPTTLPTLNVRRFGSAIGLGTISLLDLLALDDITTAGAWMPEIVFLIASIPALMVLAYYTFRSSTGEADEDEA